MNIRNGLIGLISIIALQATSAFAAPAVVVGDGSGSEGSATPVDITVNWEGDGVVIGAQFQITYDDANLTPDLTNACTSSNWGCSNPSAGVLQFVSTIVVAGLPTELIGTIAFDISSAATGTYALAVADQQFGDSGENPIPPSGTVDGELTVLGPAYDSVNPTPGAQINLSATQGDTDPSQIMLVSNIGAAGSTLEVICTMDLDPDGVWTVSPNTQFDVAQGESSPVNVSCDATADVGLHTGLMTCTHNGGNIGDAVYPLSCNIEAFTAKSPGINAGHSGAWFNPETSGQGQFIDVVPEEQFMFISWFTFTDAASDNPNEQLWYTAQGNYSGDIAVLDLFETLGGKFDDPQEVTTTQVGEVTLTFSDCDMGMMSYLFDEEELEGEFPLIRVIPGSGNVCEGLSGNATEAVDINVGMDGAWFDSDTSGQGYFIDAHPDPEGGNFIFVSWFTFGDETASGQRWLTAQGGFEGSMAEIDVFETTGGSFDDPEPVNTTKVGTMSLDFTDCSNALLSYSLPADPAEGDIAITRVIPGSQALCEELTGAD